MATTKAGANPFSKWGYEEKTECEMMWDWKGCKRTDKDVKMNEVDPRVSFFHEETHNYPYLDNKVLCDGKPLDFSGEDTENNTPTDECDNG